MLARNQASKLVAYEVVAQRLNKAVEQHLVVLVLGIGILPTRDIELAMQVQHE